MVIELVRNESGQTMTEYGILIAFLSVAVIVILLVMGGHITDIFQTVDDQLAATPIPASAT